MFKIKSYRKKVNGLKESVQDLRSSLDDFGDNLSKLNDDVAELNKCFNDYRNITIKMNEEVYDLAELNGMILVEIENLKRLDAVGDSE